ncbi:MAG: universal stress protein [Ignavibacteriaceae bacterium]
MNFPFKKLGLALTFSPTGLALLKETKRLKELFNSEIVLIHSGKKDNESELKLGKMIDDSGLAKQSTEIIWAQGNPANEILKVTKSANVDLLIAGALEKEPVLKYYLGSVARKIMREASSSVLIIESSSEVAIGFKKFCVSTDYSQDSESIIKLSYQFALMENANEFIVVRDIYTPGLSSAAMESGITSNADKVISIFQKEEEEKLIMFVRELNLKGIPIIVKCLYGREGWAERDFVQNNNIDIFAVNGKTKRSYFFDRLFPNELEFSIKHLPSNLLILR